MLKALKLISRFNYLLPYPWPKNIILDIKEQTKHPRVKETVKTLY